MYWKGEVFKHESQNIPPFFLVSGVTYRDFSFRGQASRESPRIEVSWKEIQYFQSFYHRSKYALGTFWENQTKVLVHIKSRSSLWDHYDEIQLYGIGCGRLYSWGFLGKLSPPPPSPPPSASRQQREKSKSPSGGRYVSHQHAENKTYQLLSLHKINLLKRNTISVFFLWSSKPTWTPLFWLM